MIPLPSGFLYTTATIHEVVSAIQSIPPSITFEKKEGFGYYAMNALLGDRQVIFTRRIPDAYFHHADGDVLLHVDFKRVADYGMRFDLPSLQHAVFTEDEQQAILSELQRQQFARFMEQERGRERDGFAVDAWNLLLTPFISVREKDHLFVIMDAIHALEATDRETSAQLLQLQFTHFSREDASKHPDAPLQQRTETTVPSEMLSDPAG